MHDGAGYVRLQDRLEGRFAPGGRTFEVRTNLTPLCPVLQVKKGSPEALSVKAVWSI